MAEISGPEHDPRAASKTFGPTGQMPPEAPPYNSFAISADGTIHAPTAASEKPAFDADAIFRTAEKSTVHVNGTSPELERANLATSGSGFFVDDGRPGSCLVALTNHQLHLDGEQVKFRTGGKSIIDFKTVLPDIEIQTRDGEVHKATVALLDPKHELAFVRLTDVKDAEKTCQPLHLDSHPVAVGEQLVGVGVDMSNKTHPVTGTKISDLKRGIGEATPLGTDTEQIVDLMQGNAHHGDSGTGMLRKNGKGVGIVSAGGPAGAFGTVTAAEIQQDIDLIKSKQ
jgi:S1-C subfamily serine protease